MNRLDEIEARTTAATEGPWWKNQYSDEWEVCGHEDSCGNPYLVASEAYREDAEFIAHARQDVPALVAALRAVVAIHRPVTVPGEVFGTWGETKQCEDCEQRWPCNTLDAIHRLLGDDQ